MTAPSPPPLCRYCGAPIRKVTEVLYCYAEPQRNEGVDHHTGKTIKFAVPRHRVGVFRTKAELQATVNEQVVSIRKQDDGTIWQASTWDGVRYADPYFCNGEHARLFAVLYAEGGAATNSYNEALAKQKAAAA